MQTQLGGREGYSKLSLHIDWSVILGNSRNLFLCYILMNILKTNIGTSPKLYVCFPTFYVLLLFLTLVCLIKSYMETSGRGYVYALWCWKTQEKFNGMIQDMLLVREEGQQIIPLPHPRSEPKKERARSTWQMKANC